MGNTKYHLTSLSRCSAAARVFQICLCHLFLWLSCSSPPAVHPESPASRAGSPPLFESGKSPATGEEVKNYFLEVALGSEYGMDDFSVKKWVTDLQVEVLGRPTADDLTALRSVISDLNECLAPHIRIRTVSSNGNVQVYFVPQKEFYLYEPAGIVFYGGFFWTWWNASGEIYRGRVVISSDRIEQSLRNHLIREELTQTLGLMNDSMRYPSSIFYQGYSEVTEFSPLDKSVIRFLYDDAVRAGMTSFELREWLAHAGHPLTQ